jgi:hypothetical protein
MNRRDHLKCPAVIPVLPLGCSPVHDRPGEGRGPDWVPRAGSAWVMRQGSAAPPPGMGETNLCPARAARTAAASSRAMRDFMT